MPNLSNTSLSSSGQQLSFTDPKDTETSPVPQIKKPLLPMSQSHACVRRRTITLEQPKMSDKYLSPSPMTSPPNKTDPSVLDRDQNINLPTPMSSQVSDTATTSSTPLMNTTLSLENPKCLSADGVQSVHDSREWASVCSVEPAWSNDVSKCGNETRTIEVDVMKYEQNKENMRTSTPSRHCSANQSTEVTRPRLSGSPFNISPDKEASSDFVKTSVEFSIKDLHSVTPIQEKNETLDEQRLSWSGRGEVFELRNEIEQLRATIAELKLLSQQYSDTITDVTAVEEEKSRVKVHQLKQVGAERDEAREQMRAMHKACHDMASRVAENASVIKAAKANEASKLNEINKLKSRFDANEDRMHNLVTLSSDRLVKALGQKQDSINEYERSVDRIKFDIQELTIRSGSLMEHIRQKDQEMADLRKISYGLLAQ